MTFEGALKHLCHGLTVRRAAWKSHVIGISIDPGRVISRGKGKPAFVALCCRRDDGSVRALRWSPYAADFIAEDWTTVDDDPPRRQQMTLPDLPGLRKADASRMKVIDLREAGVEPVRFDVRPGRPGYRCGCCVHFDGRDKCERSLSMVTDDEVCDAFELMELR